MNPTAARFRAVVTDLDGTVVRRDGTVSDATRRAAAALAAAGIPLIAATARTPSGIAVLGELVRDVAVAVCCNGGVGCLPSTGERLWLQALDPAAVVEIVDVLAARLPDAEIGAYDGRRWMLTDGYVAVRGTAPRGPHRIATAGRLSRRPACMLSVCHPRLGSAAVAEVLAAAHVHPGLAAVTYAADDLLDITPPGADKAAGAGRALARLGIEPADAVGFGDAPNDLPMLALVGHAVAVANAHPDVLAAADAVTACVERDGFAEALTGLGLVPDERGRPTAPSSCGQP
ncbi:MAG TPA: HAD family hydrolase [Streptosporangiales bacterium]